MADLNVSIVQLPGMWVASVIGYGEAPESEAWSRLRRWADPRGLLTGPDRHPSYGFNNPPPSRASSEYGYELWIRVDGPEPEGHGVAFKQFEGGLFAATERRLLGAPDISTTWRALWEWAQAGAYRWRRAQELEEVVNPDAAEEDLVLRLYLPVEARPSTATA